jgi:hypothetical protein
MCKRLTFQQAHQQVLLQPAQQNRTGRRLAMAKAMETDKEGIAFQPEAIDPGEPSVVFDSSEVELDAPMPWRRGDLPQPIDSFPLVSELASFPKTLVSGIRPVESPEPARTIS